MSTRRRPASCAAGTSASIWRIERPAGIVTVERAIRIRRGSCRCTQQSLVVVGGVAQCSGGVVARRVLSSVSAGASRDPAFDVVAVHHLKVVVRRSPPLRRGFSASRSLWPAQHTSPDGHPVLMMMPSACSAMSSARPCATTAQLALEGSMRGQRASRWRSRPSSSVRECRPLAGVTTKPGVGAVCLHMMIERSRRLSCKETFPWSVIPTQASPAAPHSASMGVIFATPSAHR